MLQEDGILSTEVVDVGDFGHLYPQTVIYRVGDRRFILAEDEEGKYLIKPINNNGKLGKNILDKQFRYYFDVVQAAYDEFTEITYICAVSLAGKYIEVFETNNEGLKAKYRFAYAMVGRKSFNFFFIRGQLYFYESDEKSGGTYLVKSVSVVYE